MIRDSKKEMNKSGYGTIVEGEVLKKLQHAELNILIDVVKVCKKYKIFYCLGYGTLLGAVRHSGFVPWDDDIDILMNIDDIPLFLSKLEKEYKDKYFYNGIYNNTQYLDPFKGVKIMRNGTKMVEVQCEKWPYIRGIDIDIFPIISSPKTRLGRKLQFFKLSFLNRACTLTYEYRYKPTHLLFGTSKRTNKYFKKRMRIGRFLSIIPLEKWFYRRLKFFLKKYKKSENVSFCYSGINGKETYKKSDFVLKEMEFEKRIFNVPLNYKKFLHDWYGDSYNVIPSTGDRETHVLSKIVFYE